MNRFSRNALIAALVSAFILALTATILFFVFDENSSAAGEELYYSQFIAKIEAGEINEVAVGQGVIYGEYGGGENESAVDFFTYIPYFVEGLIDMLLEHDVAVRGIPEQPNTAADILINIVPIAVLIIFLWWVISRLVGARDTLRQDREELRRMVKKEIIQMNIHTKN